MNMVKGNMQHLFKKITLLNFGQEIKTKERKTKKKKTA